MWSIVSDFANIHKVHPIVKSVDQLSPEPRGEGEKRRCNFVDGGNAAEETRNWNKDGKSYTITLVEGSLPIKSMNADFKVEDLRNGRSKATGEINIKPKLGFVSEILAHLVLKPKFGSIVRKLFSGFGYYAKTGEQVNEKHTLAQLMMSK